MRMHKTSHRVIAMLLTLVMLLSALPMTVFAAEGETVNGETVKGESVVVDANGAIAVQREVNFNKDWKFYLGNNNAASNKNFDDSSWTDVDLPHDFSIIQHFTTTNAEGESGFLPGGTGWYRKTFIMPQEAEGQSVLLNFDGVYMHADVYVNGESVGQHHFGYSNFAIDITDYLVCDGATENVVAVKAVNNFPSSRWYSGSGIYRDVTLVITDPVHVDLHGTHVTTPDIASGSGKVNVEVDVVNDGEAEVTATVKNTVYAKGSETAVANAESTVTVAAGSVATATNAPVVANPALWDTADPNLYTVKTEIVVGGKVVDTYESDFGFRWFSWSDKGFALNGKNVKLDGVCMHHDQGAAGSAAYYDAMYRQISILKDMGCNAIRTSHNPADEHFIEICNELGMLVIEENFDGLTVAKNGNYNDFSTHFQQKVDTRLYGAKDGMLCSEYSVRSIVKRDRNAPAVFAWSYGNEIQEGASAAQNFVTYCEQYINWINEEDGTRIATIGDNSKAGNAVLQQVLTKILEAGGVVGFNYHCHQANSQTLVNNWGGKWGCILASETSSHINSRGQYRGQGSSVDVDGKGHLTSYDTSAVGWGDSAHDSMYDTLTKDYIAGEFVWTGFDYIGEPTPWNDPYDTSSDIAHNSAYFGIIETTGFAKDSYYLYRAQWHDTATTLHLVTAWDADNMMTTGGKTPVWVYTNAPVVKLYRNGTHIGTTTRTVNTTAAGHVYYTYRTETVDSSVCTVQTQSGADALYSIFNVAYEAGSTLSAKAFEADGTTEIALTGNSGKNTVTTPGTASKLVISADRTEAPADSYSLIYVEVDVTDANGNLDTTATNNITFTVEGPGMIVGVDSGDQNTVKKYQNDYVKTSDTTANINAYAGKALVIVRTTDDAGEIRVNVASSGLTGGTAVVNAIETEIVETTGLQNYTMVRDYSVHEGIAPALETAVTGVIDDGSTVNGTIVWDEIPETVYGTSGDHTITGTLTFPDLPPVKVTARLHVIPNVIAVRNVSTATLAGQAPALPSLVKGVLEDGTLVGEFSVEWDAVDVSKLANVGDMLTVKGTATILGEETLPVTCTVRVAEGVQGDSKNIGPESATLTQNVPEGMQSDNLNAIIDEVTSPGENANARWTNWNNRYNDANPSITMTWDTAHGIGEVNLYYRYDGSCAKPDDVVFEYSLNGQTFEEIGATESALNVTVSAGAAFNYKFDEVVAPVALRITFTQQGGTSAGKCVGLYEAEILSYLTTLVPYTTADLSGITVDGTAIDGFSGSVLNYVVNGGSAVAASTDSNVGITVLPEYQGVIRVLTVSEDGTVAQTYAITVDEAAIEWDEVDVTLKVGETKVIKDETGNYASLYNDADLDKNIAEVKVEGVTTTAGRTLTEMANTLEDGTYVIVNDRAGKTMTNTDASAAAGAGDMSGRRLEGTIDDFGDAALWTITKVSEGVYTIQDADGKYLSVGSNSAPLSTTASNVNVVYTASGTWTLEVGGAYLNDAGAEGTTAAGWAGGTAAGDAGSQWSIYKVVTTEDENSTTITIEGKSAGETSFAIGNTRYNIKVVPASEVIDLRNVSTATRVGVVPELPETVKGVMVDGTLIDDFVVTWDTVDPADLVAGAIVTVTGTVVEKNIHGEPMDVTCSIRVADAAPASSTNVGLNATVTQDIPEEYWSDNLASVNDGNTQSEADHQGEFNTHWSNYNYRDISDKATLTFTWDTVQSLKEFYIYFRVDNWSADLPADVQISYSVDGVEFQEMTHENNQIQEEVEYGGKYSYVLDEPINAKVVKFTFTQQEGRKVETKCVALYEIQCMTVTDADALILNSFASLSAITADGTAIEGFTSDETEYEIPGDADTVIGAETEVNAGITILPIYEGVVRILTVSEDGSAEKTYEITYADECAHENTEIRGAVEATCTEPGYTGDTYCVDCGEKIADGTATEPLGHADNEPVDHICDRCDAIVSECADADGDGKCDVCGELMGVIRLAGEHRWNTAIKVADEMKANLGVEKFDAIIIASGNDFADALAGSYLSTVKNAPILLAWGQGGAFEYLDTDNINYIKANLAEDGVVYILGGEKAVPALYETELAEYEVKRLGGADRFETNILILEEAGIPAGSEVLVCTSTNFADSLSASATAKPILLVFNEFGDLFGKQPEFLGKLEDCSFTVIGGENAVGEKLVTAIEAYGEVTRLAGANRFETSVLVAEKYFEAPETAVLAYAWNYPDGLCGGSLAYSLGAPLILTMTGFEDEAVAYAESVGITAGVVLGGDGLISDEAVRAIFAMDAEDEIILK